MKTKCLLILGLGLVLPCLSINAEEKAAPSSLENASRDSRSTLSIGIQDAINYALAASPQVKMALNDLQGQRERRRGAWADVGPRVKVEYNEVYFEDKQTASLGSQEFVLRDDKAKTGSLTIGQPITGAFALAEKAKMEGAQLEIKEDGLLLSRAHVAYQAAETFLRARQTARLLEIAEASLLAAEGQRKDGLALERAGRLNHGDALKLELAVSEAKARIAGARAARDISIATLKEEMGLPSSTELNLQSSTPDVQLDPALNIDAAITSALERRIEIRQGKSGTEVASFAKKLAYANFSPEVNLFVKWDKNFGEPAGFASSDQLQRTYGVQVSWDIWNNGSHIFAVREASQGIAKAEQGLAQVEQKVRLELTQAQAQLQASEDSLALAQIALAQAQEAYRIEKVRFQSGSRSATDLVLAEASQAGAQGRLITAQTDLLSWQLKLQYMLGESQPKFR